MVEIIAAGAAHIHTGGDACGEADIVRLDTVVTGPGLWYLAGVVAVQMCINKAGGHIQAAYIDYLFGICGVEIGGNSGNLAVCHSHVCNAVNAVGRVNYMTVFQQNVIFFHNIYLFQLRRLGRNRETWGKNIRIT